MPQVTLADLERYESAERKRINGLFDEIMLDTHAKRLEALRQLERGVAIVARGLKEAKRDGAPPAV